MKLPSASTVFCCTSVLAGDTPEPSPLRTTVRVVLGSLIALLAAYIAIEQIGHWRRRRSGRE